MGMGHRQPATHRAICEAPTAAAVSFTSQPVSSLPRPSLAPPAPTPHPISHHAGIGGYPCFPGRAAQQPLPAAAEADACRVCMCAVHTLHCVLSVLPFWFARSC